MNRIEITILEKTNGPLTKKIRLSAAGELHSDGSACALAHGRARRFGFDRLGEFSQLIEGFRDNQAIALGQLRDGLPPAVEIVPKRRLNGATAPAKAGVISRTLDFFGFRPGEFGFCLLDFDRKAMPPAVADRITRLGGVWPALVDVVPDLARVARLERASTSAGLFHCDTGVRLAEGGGLHIYVVVSDGADIERFLRDLHRRCWLKGLGWLMVGRAGQLLERSIIDASVGSPERLVFEGPPQLEPPLAQDLARRKPVVAIGGALDTIKSCPPLSLAEAARMPELRAREEVRLGPQIAKARAGFIAEQAQRLASRAGIPAQRARHIVERQCGGVLLPDLDLAFDDPDLSGSTVADILADPEKFIDATLADPLEGLEYGPGKAKVLRRPDGGLMVNSFAHGGATYELKLDCAAVRAILERTAVEEVVAVFIRCVLTADLDRIENEQLSRIVCKNGDIGKRDLDAMLKEARAKQTAERRTAELTAQRAARNDTRPQFFAPVADAPWLPEMAILSEILGAADEPEPPLRDIDDFVHRAGYGAPRTCMLLARSAPMPKTPRKAACRRPSSRCSAG